MERKNSRGQCVAELIVVMCVLAAVLWSAGDLARQGRDLLRPYVLSKRSK